MKVDKHGIQRIEMSDFLSDMGVNPARPPKKRTGKMRTPEEQKAAHERWWMAESRRRENARKLWCEKQNKAKEKSYETRTKAV